MEEEDVVSLIIVFVVVCIVNVHVFDSSHPLPRFGSKSFCEFRFVRSSQSENMSAAWILIQRQFTKFGLLGRWFRDGFR